MYYFIFFMCQRIIITSIKQPLTIKLSLHQVN